MSGSANTLRHILITGASGGLGSALASEYAASGTSLTLLGRNMQRLEQTATICNSRQAQTSLMPMDLSNISSSLASIIALDVHYPLDIVILNAGVTSGTRPDGKMEPASDVLQTIQVNALAPIALASALLERMLIRGKGHIIMISSIAAFYPLPFSPAYCAAKAALQTYVRATRENIKNTDLRLSIVYPGYIDTPMSRRLSGNKPQCLRADQAAKLIRKKLEAGKDEIIFPLLLGLGIRTLNLMPRKIASFFTRQFAFSVDPALPEAQSASYTNKEKNKEQA